MRDARDLVVSVPPRELAAIRPQGSVFPSQALGEAAISEELRRALGLFPLAPGEARAVVARPEIFTHGESLAWLHAQIGGARQHLAFSDGTTIPLIPGLANHVFFYGAARRADRVALEALEARVPELFAQVRSQVNAAYRFGPLRRAPDCYVWPGRSGDAAAGAPLLRFYAHPHLVAECVARILHWGEVLPPEAGYSRLLYVPLTEAGLDDPAFLAETAGAVARAFFRPETAAVLRLPSPAAATEARLAAVLRALQKTGAPIPSVPAANVYFALEDAPRAQLAALAPARDFLAPDSFDFWRHPPDYYAGFASLRVAARRRRHAPGALPVLLAELTGREATLLWPSPQRATGADRGPA